MRSLLLHAESLPFPPCDVQLGGQLGEAWLFTGCRSEEDHLFKEELQGFRADGTLSQLHVSRGREVLDVSCVVSYCHASWVTGAVPDPIFACTYCPKAFPVYVCVHITNRPLSVLLPGRLPRRLQRQGAGAAPDGAARGTAGAAAAGQRPRLRVRPPAAPRHGQGGARRAGAGADVLRRHERGAGHRPPDGHGAAWKICTDTLELVVRHPQ